MPKTSQRCWKQVLRHNFRFKLSWIMNYFERTTINLSVKDSMTLIMSTLIVINDGFWLNGGMRSEYFSGDFVTTWKQRDL